MSVSSQKIASYYDLLGVPADAGPEEIKRAYLNKIKQWHPDKNPEGAEAAEEKSKALNQAYHVLGDAERRKNYDRMLRFTRGVDFEEHINDDSVKAKLKKAYPAFKTVFENVRELYALFKDAVRGDFELPQSSVAIIGGGLLYFIMPMDLIPDFIPVVGYLDDLAVLTTIMTTLKDEIEVYRAWKGGEEAPKTGTP